MNMRKRLWAAALALVMTVTALTGCGGKIVPGLTGGKVNGSGSAGGSASYSDSAGGSGAGSSAQGPAMDLTGVTDPYLAVSGLAGDTVVARLGDEDIPASLLLYWLTMAGGVDEALDVACVHSQIHLLARQEGLTPDPSILQVLEQDYANVAAQVGSEEMADHVLWVQLLDRDLLAYLNESTDLYDQLCELYYGENSGHYPTDAEVNAYLEETGQYRCKHILLATIDLATREPLDEKTIARKKATADDFLARLRAAEDPITLFDQLMNEHSEDTGLAANPDGYTTSKGEMVAPFEKAALALNVGEISDVVESDFGYHIILRLPMNADEFRDSCVSYLLEQRMDALRETTPLEKLPALDKLDIASFQSSFTALQTAVYAELNAINSQGDTSGSGNQG